jgi:hypothetical protein
MLHYSTNRDIFNLSLQTQNKSSVKVRFNFSPACVYRKYAEDNRLVTLQWWRNLQRRQVTMTDHPFIEEMDYTRKTELQECLKKKWYGIKN